MTFLERLYPRTPKLQPPPPVPYDRGWALVAWTITSGRLKGLVLDGEIDGLDIRQWPYADAIPWERRPDIMETGVFLFVGEVEVKDGSKNPALTGKWFRLYDTREIHKKLAELRILEVEKIAAPEVDGSEDPLGFLR